jgi:hypothetical protein
MEINEGLLDKNIYEMGGFSNAMFEYQRIPPILGTTLYEFCLEL